jgi:hypothetical protein
LPSPALGDPILKLSVRRSGVVPDVPDDAQVWRDWSGVPRAYGYTLGGEHWIRLPDVASFRFTAAGEAVEAIAQGSTPGERVEDAYRRHVLPFVMQALGWELLHASAVMTPRGALAFCGPSGAGKSTLAHELDRRGYPPLADDALPFETINGAVHAIPMSFTLRVSGRSVPYGEEWGREAKGPESVPLAAVFVLERTAEVDPAHPEITPLPNSSALPLLLYHAHCFSFRDQRRTRLMADRYLALAAQVPAFQVRYQPDLDWLPTLLDSVERAPR